MTIKDSQVVFVCGFRYILPILCNLGPLGPAFTVDISESVTIYISIVLKRATLQGMYICKYEKMSRMNVCVSIAS